MHTPGLAPRQTCLGSELQRLSALQSSSPGDDNVMMMTIWWWWQYDDDGNMMMMTIWWRWLAGELSWWWCGCQWQWWRWWQWWRRWKSSNELIIMSSFVITIFIKIVKIVKINLYPLLVLLPTDWLSGTPSTSRPLVVKPDQDARHHREDNGDQHHNHNHDHDDSDDQCADFDDVSMDNHDHILGTNNSLWSQIRMITIVDPLSWHIVITKAY